MSEIKKQIDWERIEFDYRAGIMSLREMADSNGITHGAINKRAKRDGWTRDLKAKIQAKAAILVSRQAVSTEVSTKRAVTENDVVEANANRIADAVQLHTGTSARFLALNIKLAEEIEAQTNDPEIYQKLGEMMAAPDEKGVDKLNDLYMKVIGTPSRIDSMKKLAETFKTLVSVNRQALGMDEESKPSDDPIGAFLKQCSGRSLPIAADVD